MRTTFRFLLPFPLLGLPPDGLETEGQSHWPSENPLRPVVLPTKLRLKLIHHAQPPVMQQLGWTAHGTGTATYSGDTKGLFSITEVQATVEGLRVAPLGDHVQMIYCLVAMVNSFIEQHTAVTATLLTPRATPQDIVGLEVTATGDDGRVSRGAGLSFGNTGPMVQALKPLMTGSPPPYASLANAWNLLWGRTMLDGVREFLALRPVRAAQLTALGFELFLNAVLIEGGAEIEKRTLKEKGEDLLGPRIGGGLNSRKTHGDVASAWMLILAGRNALLHREEARFQWTTVEGRKQLFDVSDLTQAGRFLADAATIVGHVQATLRPPVSADTPR